MSIEVLNQGYSDYKTVTEGSGPQICACYIGWSDLDTYCLNKLFYLWNIPVGITFVDIKIEFC